MKTTSWSLDFSSRALRSASIAALSSGVKRWALSTMRPVSGGNFGSALAEADARSKPKRRSTKAKKENRPSNPLTPALSPWERESGGASRRRRPLSQRRGTG